MLNARFNGSGTSVASTTLSPSQRWVPLEADQWIQLRIECGSCATTVPVHSGEDLGPGLLRSIERDLEPCLGKGWLKKS